MKKSNLNNCEKKSKKKIVFDFLNLVKRYVIKLNHLITILIFSLQVAKNKNYNKCKLLSWLLIYMEQDKDIKYIYIYIHLKKDKKVTFN